METCHLPPREIWVSSLTLAKYKAWKPEDKCRGPSSTRC